ncbi:unnamed protein product [Triticum turgidum subsp. durum]|uniref:Leucine-rich repeat-containing N-terminal plant-type domain-containing protein n=1 Tax=Triticum turgidum subsp. durum TaxID=4567 RepID=A0A9R0YIP4_TRITD|nr:unnamed protein product [Triticum turgidum subsp. durum]
MRFLTVPPVVLHLFLLLFLASPATACTKQEKRNLLQFLAGLSQDGGLAASWRDNGTDCCEWEGVVCNGDGAVAEVSLGSKGLEGRISPSLADLTSLLHVNLSYNSFSGGLPPELMFSGSIIVLDVSFSRLNGPLPELPYLVTTDRPLQVLNISSNQFSSEFPSATWKVMKNLIALNASNNSFTGHIPSSLCIGLPSLALLDLCYNQLSGDIPNTLGNCSKLKVLKAGNNHISGILPVEIFHATSLEYLSFPNNGGLQGELDGAHIVKLNNLLTLDLGGNSFSGTIPESIGQLRRLEELHLGSNNMSGELPSTMSNCTNLKTIDLKINNFSGNLGKVNFATLPNLKTLDLMKNNLSGIIPESIYSCSNLTALRLSINHFHGEISTRIGNLKHLSFLSLTENSFTNITKVLHALQSCRSISVLLIGKNFMNEAMPPDETIDGFQNLQYLMTMFKSDKAGIYSDPSLLDLGLLIYAADPSKLQYRINSARAKELNLGNNKFTGVIPQEIGQLKALLYLNLSSNNFYGEIPQSIGNLTDLQKLDLSNNHLTGEIPAALEILHFLSEFNISNNNLEGPIPTKGQLSTFQASSFNGNPKLCGSLLINHCDSVEAPPISIISAKQCSNKVTFAIAFGVFFGVGVLYDQLVLFRYFG